MELPITIVFEPPSRAELRALLRNRWIWFAAAGLLTVAIGILLVVVSASRAEALATSTGAVLSIRSRPPGADITLDGHSFGQTPLDAPLQVGPHQLRLSTPDAIAAEYRLTTGTTDSAFDALLWQRQPRVTRLRAAVPGALLSNAHLAAGGRVTLVLGPGPEHDLSAWRFEPTSGIYEPILADFAGARLSVAPDGQHVAYVGPEIGPRTLGQSVLDRVLWVAPSAQPDLAPSALWQAPAGESLIDLSWAPTGQQLLAVTAENQTLRVLRSRVWLVDVASGEVRPLLAIPSLVVPGALSWSPDGQRVAFMVHAGSLNALCVLGLDGQFRYLADLDPSDGAPLPLPPLSWSADGQQALFVAPRQDPPASSATWLQPRGQRVLYVADTDGPAPRVVGEADASLAAWREDGQLMVLSRARDGSLSIDLLGDGPRPTRLVDLPLIVDPLYAAEWDTGTGRMLVASRAGGEIEYFLIRFALEDQR